jgi:hypothetical protein
MSHMPGRLDRTVEEIHMSELAVTPETQPAATVAVAEARNDPNLAPAAPADCTPAQQAERRYLAALQPLVDDALEHRHIEVLVEVLTWHLARIGYGYGASAVGDIVRRLGVHIGDIAAREAAHREAQEAKKAGRAPH